MPILNWLTRDEDIRTAQSVPYRLLEEVPVLSAGDGGAGNMLIQGDNLEALKALLPFYAGRVKCIYIDPPYNTRSAFEHYDDAHIADGPDTAEKRTIGQLWERKSGGKGLFVVVEKTVDGRDMRAQMVEKIVSHP